MNNRLTLLFYSYKKMTTQKKRLSTIFRKFLMAISGLFLMSFLVMHLSINMMSVVSSDLFNQASHFMGTNPVIQGLLQPILIFGVVYHFVMGMILEYQNRSARTTKYAMYKGSANASWMSRNMIITGLVVLAFLALHFYDFFIPELNVKYIEGNMTGKLPNGEFRYFEELVHKFESPARVGLYVLSFVFLALHLLHGFQSSFQSIGVNHPRYTPIIKTLGNIFAIAVPVGFIFIAIFHFING
jgi:succinate dehydrogenase / fumarate reductase cytochrome b subunit